MASSFDPSRISLIPDTNFIRDEEQIIKECLDSTSKLIKLCEQPQAFVGRKALASLIETLPIRTSHVLRKQ